MNGHFCKLRKLSPTQEQKLRVVLAWAIYGTFDSRSSASFTLWAQQRCWCNFSKHDYIWKAQVWVLFLKRSECCHDLHSFELSGPVEFVSLSFLLLLKRTLRKKWRNSQLCGRKNARVGLLEMPWSAFQSKSCIFFRIYIWQIKKKIVSPPRKSEQNII